MEIRKRRASSYLFLLICLCAVVNIGASSIYEIPQQTHDDGNEERTYKVDKDTYEALKSFKTSGMNIVQLMKEMKALRARAIKLAQEKAALKKSLREERAKTKVECTNAKQDDSPSRNGQSWKEFIFGGFSKDGEEVLTVKGCEDAVCCFRMLFQLLTEGSHHWFRLIRFVVLDPIGWVTGNEGGLWSTALGLFFVFWIYQLAVWVIFSFGSAWKGITIAFRAFFSLPGFRLWGLVFKHLGFAKEKESNAKIQDSTELAELKAQIAELKAQIAELVKELEEKKQEAINEEMTDEHCNIVDKTQQDLDASKAQDEGRTKSDESEFDLETFMQQIMKELKVIKGDDDTQQTQRPRMAMDPSTSKMKKPRCAQRCSMCGSRGHTEQRCRMRMQCAFCGKRGHEDDACWSRSKQVQKKKMDANIEDQSEGASQKSHATSVMTHDHKTEKPTEMPESEICPSEISLCPKAKDASSSRECDQLILDSGAKSDK